jgi:hypothetical protein
MNHFTSKLQVKRLLAIGINPKTCDMLYEHTGWVSLDTPTVRWCEDIGCHMPCWSTGQLVDLYRAVRKFLSGKWYNPRVLQEDEINPETIVSELEHLYNHIHTHYDCKIDSIRDWYDFSHVTID